MNTVNTNDRADTPKPSPAFISPKINIKLKNARAIMCPAVMFANKRIINTNGRKNKPKISVFDNKYEYSKMLVESHITFNSSCEHHFLPIVGKAHIGYISSGKVIGLSKMNRIVRYYGQRPQVQERMTMQIFNELKAALQTEDVIVVVEAEHLCVSSRGVNDKSSKTTTIEYGGDFGNNQIRNDFFKMI